MSEPDTTWWTLGDVVEWVQGIDPAATVWQIRIELAGRCASGRIRAHGRRWVYRYDQPLWIDHGDPLFVVVSDQYGGPQSSFEAISADEWNDLTFFARRTPGMDRRYEVGLEQALAQLVSPVERRSLSKHRLAWRDVEFWRADVIGEWFQTNPVTTENEAGHQPRSDPVGRSGSPTPGPVPISDSMLHSWYEGRVAEMTKRGDASSGEEDWEAAKQQFPERVTRARVRAARKKFAPVGWKKQGRRSPPTAN
jgi:hypothetical protein